MAYCTPAQALNYMDARTAGDLCGDVGIQVSAAGLLTDDVFAAALAAGAGEIEAALMQGQRYTAAQLTALTGNSAAMLQRINARLALRILWQRRPWVEDQGRIASFEEADKILRDLATGKIVFDIDDHKSASVATITGPSTATVQRLQGIATQARGNFYPAMRLPYGR